MKRSASSIVCNLLNEASTKSLYYSATNAILPELSFKQGGHDDWVRRKQSSMQGCAPARRGLPIDREPDILNQRVSAERQQDEDPREALFVDPARRDM